MSIQKINRKSKPFLVRCRDLDGKYISATFATRSEAELFEKSQQNEKIMPAELQLTATDRADISRIKNLCKTYHCNLSDVVEILQKALVERCISKLSLSEAKEKFLHYCKTKNVRPSTYIFYEGHLNRFAPWFSANGYDNVYSFTKSAAQAYIDVAKNKSHIKSALRAVWNYLVSSGYAKENVFEDVKIGKTLKNKTPISILSVQATEENLRALRPEFVPMYALMTFAGIRPEEIIAEKKTDQNKDYLRYEDIDFERRRITIRSEVAKTREMRIIYGLSNLWAWLEPIKEWKSIYPKQIEVIWNKKEKRLTDKIFQQWRTAKSKLPHKIPKDALRHSFASYAYHKYGVEKAVEILGHDYNVYRKHYKSLASEEDSIKYFDILPIKKGEM